MSEAKDFAELKQRLHATWSAGDYGRVAEGLRESAETWVDDLGLSRGIRLLDIACGAGQVAIPAARAGAEVTGIDLVEDWVEQARARAGEEDLEIRFEVGDAEDLPCRVAGFDVTASLIGAMFAPRPERVASEMLRVTKPGGRIAMGNWTAESFVGRMFRTVAAHVPPPEGMPSPLLWGDEATVRARFGEGLASLEMRRRPYRLAYDMTPPQIAEHYGRNFGPLRTALGRLDAVGRAALLDNFAALWREADIAGREGHTAVESEILDIRGTRA